MSYKRLMACCLLCKNEICSNNIPVHYNSKLCRQGTTFKQTLTQKREWCIHCDMSFDNKNASERANHTRWCTLNPNRDNTKTSTDTSHLNTKEAIIKRAEKIKQAHKKGKYVDAAVKALETKKRNGTFKHTEETKRNMSKVFSTLPHQRACKSTHTYIDKKGRTFRFDSKWEDALADRLDTLDIRWTRPGPIPYFDGEKRRNYFPDFYLIDYDLYIDPKNPWVEEQQKKKLDIVSQMIQLLILRSLNECKNFSIWPASRESNPN